MPRISLSKGAIKVIHNAIDLLFEKARARFLGRKPPKQIKFTYNPHLTLPGIFNAASAEERTKPDPQILDSLTQIAEGYFDAHQARAKSQVVKAVDSFLKEAEAKGEEGDVEEVLGQQLESIWEKTTADLTKVVDTESTNARNTGVLDGIIKINAAVGNNDSVVYWVVVRDGDLCEECRRLHLMPDGISPRCYYLSEVGQGYHRKGQDSPKVGGLHPHCRCSIATLMRGYGFINGAVTYIGPDHDEVEKQRAED